MKKAEVIWLDACLEEAHVPQEAIGDIQPLRRKNLGYLISEDSDAIRLAFGVIENFYENKTAYDLVLVIPRGMIETIKEEAPAEIEK